MYNDPCVLDGASIYNYMYNSNRKIPYMMKITHLLKPEARVGPVATKGIKVSGILDNSFKIFLPLNLYSVELI